MKILNVGCGTETYGTHFTDLSSQRKEVVICDNDKDRLPFPDEYFDEVYSRNLLEHITNLGFFMSECFRVLKKGGKLKLSTDNANYWLWNLNGTHTGSYEVRKEAFNSEDRHYMLFTAGHLSNLARKVGFKVIKTSYERHPFGTNRLWYYLKESLNSILMITPFWRSAYAIVKLEAEK
jgi:predicted SAM-dependent methyltransferase